MKALKNLATGLALAVSSSYASATIILPAGYTVLEDDNLEYVIDANGNYKTSGTLEVGDRLRSVISFQAVTTIGNVTVTQLAGTAQELTGISEIEVVSTAGGMITFGASSSFEATYGVGAVGALFEQGVGDFSTDCHVSGPGTCETTASNGNPWMVAGLVDEDDFWIAGSSLPGIGLDNLDLSIINGMASTSAFATASYALSIIENNTGYAFREQYSGLSGVYTAGNGDSMTDIVGSGSLLGGQGLTGPYFARSDFDFQLYTVPLPGTLALMGLGLLGLAYRRRNAS